MSANWRRVGHHAGYLGRTIPASESVSVPRVSDRDRARDAKRLEAVPAYLDWGTIKRLVARDAYGLGGEIADVIGSRSTCILVDGVAVAARCLTLYVSYDPELGTDDGAAISDAINVTLYRNPANPRQLMARIGTTK